MIKSVKLEAEAEEPVFVEAEAIAVVKSSPKYAARILTDFTCSSAEETLSEWKRFGEKIIVKYNDFVVKGEKNGKVERGNTGLAGRVKRPGYPQEFLKRVVEETGERYLIPDTK